MEAAAQNDGVAPPDARSQVADLLIPAIEALRQGKLIEGIRILRQSGLGLAEAKALLERAQREGISPHDLLTGQDHPPAGELPLEAMLALRNGNMVEAVRLYRAKNGGGLKDAKDALEAYLADDPLLQRQYDAARAEHGGRWKRHVATVVVILLLAGAWLALRSS